MDFLEFVKEIGIEKWDFLAIIENPNILPDQALDCINIFLNDPDVLHGQILDYLYALSANPNLNIKFIKDHLEIDWDFKTISQNIDTKQIIDHPELPWDYNRIIENKKLTIDQLVQIADKFTDWTRLTKIMPIKDMLKHPKLPWDKEIVKYNKTLLVNGDFEEQLLVPENPSFEYLISNVKTNWTNFTKYVDYMTILSRPDLPWNYDMMSKKDLPLNVIKEYQDVLNFQLLSEFTYPQIILDNPDLPWSYDDFSRNDRLSFKIVLDNPDLPWNYYEMSAIARI
jgi:hypothetical protein